MRPKLTTTETKDTEDSKGSKVSLESNDWQALIDSFLGYPHKEKSSDLQYKLIPNADKIVIVGSKKVGAHLFNMFKSQDSFKQQSAYAFSSDEKQIPLSSEYEIIETPMLEIKPGVSKLIFENLKNALEDKMRSRCGIDGLNLEEENFILSEKINDQETLVFTEGQLQFIKNLLKNLSLTQLKQIIAEKPNLTQLKIQNKQPGPLASVLDYICGLIKNPDGTGKLFIDINKLIQCITAPLIVPKKQSEDLYYYEISKEHLINFLATLNAAGIFFAPVKNELNELIGAQPVFVQAIRNDSVSDPNHYCIVLDLSRSMASIFFQLRQEILKFLTLLRQNSQAGAIVQFFTFKGGEDYGDHDSREFNIEDKAIEEYINSLKPDGERTNLGRRILDASREIKPSKTVFVFTDGIENVEVNDGHLTPKLEADLKAKHKELREQLSPVKIYGIQFGSDPSSIISDICNLVDGRVLEIDKPSDISELNQLVKKINAPRVIFTLIGKMAELAKEKSSALTELTKRIPVYAGQPYAPGIMFPINSEEPTEVNINGSTYQLRLQSPPPVQLQSPPSTVSQPRIGESKEVKNDRPIEKPVVTMQVISNALRQLLFSAYSLGVDGVRQQLQSLLEMFSVTPTSSSTLPLSSSTVSSPSSSSSSSSSSSTHSSESNKMDNPIRFSFSGESTPLKPEQEQTEISDPYNPYNPFNPYGR